MLTMINEQILQRDGQTNTGEEATVSESRLIERVQSGDTEAFYELVHPYERAVYLAALSFMRNEADAEEVAHKKQT